MSNATKPAPKQASEYDEAKLESMTEPLTITVEKMIAGRPQPIELPIKPGEDIAGKGWSKNDVRELPTFLGRKATGAGLVRIRVTDVNQVAMRWEWFFSPQDYQHIAAPSNDPSAPAAQLGNAAAVGQQQPMMQQPIQVQPPMGDPYGGWLGTVARQGGVPGSMRPVGAYTPMNGPMNLPPGVQAMYPQFAVPPPITTADDRLRDEREARLRLEADMARQNLENRYKEQIGGVSGEVRQLQTAIGQISQLMQRPPVEEAASATTRAMQAEIESLKAAQREDKMLAAITASQQQTTQMIQAMQANTDKQIAAMTALVTQKPNGPDPTMTMMMQMQKDASDRQMQMMQMQMTQQAAGAANQLGPREWIELTRSMNVGSEQQAVAYSKAWELMMQGVETILHAQGPGVHPAIEMLGQGIAAAAGIGEKFVEMKNEVGKQQAGAVAMQAQSNMHLANQIALQRQQQAQLSGAAVTDNRVVTAGQPRPVTAEPEGEEGEETEGEEQAPVAATAVAGRPVSAIKPAEHSTEAMVDDDARAERKKIDQQAFGAALPFIRKLRKEVIDSNLDSNRAAALILQGVDGILKRKAKVPAMELWVAGQLAECIELILPDSTMMFRERVIEAIVQFVAQAQAAAAQQQGG